MQGLLQLGEFSHGQLHAHTKNQLRNQMQYIKY